ncbi:MAG: hypothetical protein K2I62_05670 [Alistipes sp.]|nr:hypothetical protein [Alistipes sp.]MDE5691322.1 hypothetical protein [Alistipes sp.]MDE6507187.1 hypothetical protein [Alistipes sp.]MDE7078266.1 hypothetical protein [Alistipes sp.]
MNDTKNNWENRQTEQQFGDKIDRSTDCKNKTEKTVDTVKNGVENAAHRVGDTARKAGDSIKQGAEKAADKIGQAADKATDRLQGKKSY